MYYMIVGRENGHILYSCWVQNKSTTCDPDVSITFLMYSNLSQFLNFVQSPDLISSSYIYFCTILSDDKTFVNWNWANSRLYLWVQDLICLLRSPHHECFSSGFLVFQQNHYSNNQLYKRLKHQYQKGCVCGILELKGNLWQFGIQRW